ncbi:unnamed protein product [Amoebophrya sp. A120]|nr:unnamed protein product [Amoebophrya sp. A120]|eukprot:GSA120T00025696001.1
MPRQSVQPDARTASDVHKASRCRVAQHDLLSVSHVLDRDHHHGSPPPGRDHEEADLENEPHSTHDFARDLAEGLTRKSHFHALARVANNSKLKETGIPRKRYLFPSLIRMTCIAGVCLAHYVEKQCSEMAHGSVWKRVRDVSYADPVRSYKKAALEQEFVQRGDYFASYGASTAHLVLPWLMALSGTLEGLSSSPLWSRVLWCGVVLGLGLLSNYLNMVLGDEDPRFSKEDDFAFNLVYQMGFMVVLIAFTVLVRPLKVYLNGGSGISVLQVMGGGERRRERDESTEGARKGGTTSASTTPSHALGQVGIEGARQAAAGAAFPAGSDAKSNVVPKVLISQETVTTANSPDTSDRRSLAVVQQSHQGSSRKKSALLTSVLAPYMALSLSAVIVVSVVADLPYFGLVTSLFLLAVFLQVTAGVVSLAAFAIATILLQLLPHFVLSLERGWPYEKPNAGLPYLSYQWAKLAYIFFLGFTFGGVVMKFHASPEAISRAKTIREKHLESALEQSGNTEQDVFVEKGTEHLAPEDVHISEDPTLDGTEMNGVDKEKTSTRPSASEENNVDEARVRTPASPDSSGPSGSCVFQGVFQETVFPCVFALLFPVFGIFAVDSIPYARPDLESPGNQLDEYEFFKTHPRLNLDPTTWPWDHVYDSVLAGLGGIRATSAACAAATTAGGATGQPPSGLGSTTTEVCYTGVRTDYSNRTSLLGQALESLFLDPTVVYLPAEAPNPRDELEKRRSLRATMLLRDCVLFLTFFALVANKTEDRYGITPPMDYWSLLAYVFHPVVLKGRWVEDGSPLAFLGFLLSTLTLTMAVHFLLVLLLKGRVAKRLQERHDLHAAGVKKQASSATSVFEETATGPSDEVSAVSHEETMGTGPENSCVGPEVAKVMLRPRARLEAHMISSKTSGATVDGPAPGRTATPEAEETSLTFAQRLDFALLEKAKTQHPVTTAAEVAIQTFVPGGGRSSGRESVREQVAHAVRTAANSELRRELQDAYLNSERA